MSSIREMSENGGKDYSENGMFDQAIDCVRKVKYKRSSTIVRKRQESTQSILIKPSNKATKMQ